MGVNFPSAGQVFEYHYLWKLQADRGETEGRKRRPCCVTIVVVNAVGQHVMFIAPITGKVPEANRQAIQVPETEARRAKLDMHLALYVMIDELNADVLETSYTLEDRSPRGTFSAAFTDAIVRGVQEVRKTGQLKLANRQ